MSLSNTLHLELQERDLIREIRNDRDHAHLETLYIRSFNSIKKLKLKTTK